MCVLPDFIANDIAEKTVPKTQCDLWIHAAAKTTGRKTAHHNGTNITSLTKPPMKGQSCNKHTYTHIHVHTFTKRWKLLHYTLNFNTPGLHCMNTNTHTHDQYNTTHNSSKQSLSKLRKLGGKKQHKTRFSQLNTSTKKWSYRLPLHGHRHLSIYCTSIVKGICKT